MTRAPAAGKPIRLQRYLAQAGVAARRKAEELIAAGLRGDVAVDDLAGGGVERDLARGEVIATRAYTGSTNGGPGRAIKYPWR